METDWKKKYEEALGLAKSYYGKGQNEFLDTLFPELAESEDERIRKALVWHLKADVDFVSNGVTKAECIAYLEKQKEQKPVTYEDDFVSEHKTSLEILKHYLIWAENSEEDCPYTWKELAAAIKDGITALEQKPAEWNDTDMKEARDNLISVCRDWEFGKQTTLLPIVAIRARYFLEHLAEPKLAEWSEDIICKAIKEVGLTQHQINWFKNNVFPPKQEWSEEDEVYLQDALWCVKQAAKVARGENDMGACWSAERWLKSLRPQPHWEPSDEQPEVDLEVRKQIEELANDWHHKGFASDEDCPLCMQDLMDILWHFYELGKKDMKEQMLKDAVEGYVNYYEDSGGILMAEAQVGCPYHNGDKVHIIIVKEDK